MSNPEKLYELKSLPAVFAIGENYQIMALARTDVLFWVTVGGKDYFDHSNGIVRSSCVAHRVNVPMAALDEAKEYTVHYRRVIDRKPYYPEWEDIVSQTIPFKPVPTEGPIKIYHLSDTHGQFDAPAKAALASPSGDVDLLILNGDIIDHSGDIKNFDLIYNLCAAITGGSRPVIFSRGNHDTRGFYAENIAEYTPTDRGDSYFTFRLGRIWGVVLDQGEDKHDDNVSYTGPYGAIACTFFREQETEFLRNVVANADKEYNAPGVEYRLVVGHCICSHTGNYPFNVDEEILKEWGDILKDEIHPQLYIAGHHHSTSIHYPGGGLDQKGNQCCPVIIGSRGYKTEDKRRLHYGASIVLDGLKADVKFNNGDGEIHENSAVLDLIK